MPTVDVVIPTRAKQIMSDCSRDISLVAHRRWLKTRVGILKTIFGNKQLKGALKDPGSNFFVVLPTYKQAKMVAWDILKDYARPFSVKANESELVVIFPNNSKISLKGSDKPDSLRGGALDGCVFDEWAFHENPEVATRILGPALADRKGWKLKTTTLNGENHAWEDHLAAESKYLFRASETGVIAPDELERLKKELPEEEYLQEMECIPLRYAGQIYKEFEEARNEVKVPFDIPGSWTHIIGLDWGLSHNTAIVFGAIDYDGNLYIYDEVIDNDKPVQYYAQIIRDKIAGISYQCFISPDTLAQDHFRHGVRYSVYQEFQDNGINVRVANNSVIAGINKCKQLFIAGKLRIFSRCIELKQGLKRYKWKQGEGKEAPAKVKDDEVDALRYLVATYFEAPKEVKKVEVPEMSLEHFRRIERERQRKQSTVGGYAIVERN